MDKCGVLGVAIDLRLSSPSNVSALSNVTGDSLRFCRSDMRTREHVASAHSVTPDANYFAADHHAGADDEFERDH